MWLVSGACHVAMHVTDKQAASFAVRTCVWVLRWIVVSSGARASESHQAWGEERRGEREGQHHHMPQTDWLYFYWAPCRGPGCNYTTHTHTQTHTHIVMHTHTHILFPDRLRKVPSSWFVSFSFCSSRYRSVTGYQLWSLVLCDNLTCYKFIHHSNLHTLATRALARSGLAHN